MYTYDEAYALSLEYFNGDELAAKVFVDKYALRDKKDNILEPTPKEMHQRLAKEFARIEKNKFAKPLSEKQIFQLFDRFKRIVPQGSPMYGIGNPYQYVSISNCFVIPSPYDSYPGIMYTDTQITQISCRRGGVGWDISKLRPAKLEVSNAAKTTSGAIEFMKRFSNTIREVCQDGRRGASLQSISIHHPDILEFIKVKRDLTQVTGSNITVQFTDEFMNAVDKDTDFELRWPVNQQHADEMGISFPVISKIVRAKDIWNEFIIGARDFGEPGACFIDNVYRESTGYNHGLVEISSNPCITGDTTVYVADGRGNVNIKRLADEGKDVDVFCLNDKGRIAIRKLRNPRKTGDKVEVVKVTLDDGSTIRCTKNHKFLKKSGEYCEAKDLKYGDSLFIITKFEASIKDIFPNANSRSSDYFWINDGSSSNKSEHRLIAERHYGKIEVGCVVHHIDYNSQNNIPDNLRVMTRQDHDALHSKDMIGDKNPMRRAKHEWSNEKWRSYKQKMSKATSGERNGRWLGYSDETLLKHAIILTKKLNRRFSPGEWKNYAREQGLPIDFSRNRSKVFGGIKGLATIAAKKCNCSLIDVDPRLIKTYQNMLDQGYEAKITNQGIVVKKKCESCQDDFWIKHDRREAAFCSHKCVGQYLSSDDTIRNAGVVKRNQFEDSQREIKREKQLKIYNSLKFQLKREPLCKEWETECKKQNVPCRIGKHSAFKQFRQLKEAASNYNHKVISVENDGYEDVYNGTVDDYHNFLIGGFESTTDNNKRKWQYLVNRQCGEQYLPAYSSCRLILILLLTYVKNQYTSDAYFDFDAFYEDCYLMQRLADDMVDLEIESVDKIIKKIESDPEPQHIKQIALDLWNNIQETSKQDRRTGCGYTGLGDTIAALGLKYGSDESIEFAEKMQRTLKMAVYQCSVDMAKELGAFDAWTDITNDLKSTFIQRLQEENPKLIEEMSIYGRRNSVLITLAPTGSVSCLTQTTSGIEPVFELEYMRRKKGNPGDKNFKTDFIDQNGDHWQQFKIKHKGLQDWINITGETDITKSPYYGATANDINWLNKVKLQGVIQKHIDNSISVTTNLPNNVSYETVSNIYMHSWKNNVKGCTVYRDGCRTGVLVKDNEKLENEIKDRPKELDCDVHHITVKGQQYFVLVGLLDNTPFEIFAGKNGILSKDIKHGKIIKKKKNFYKVEFEDESELSPITAVMSETEEIISRLTSALLRGRIPMSDIVHQVEKVGDRTDINSFARGIARVLKKYIPEGTEIKNELCPECSGKLIRKEGCKACITCGWSKC